MHCALKKCFFQGSFLYEGLRAWEFVTSAPSKDGPIFSNRPCATSRYENVDIIWHKWRSLNKTFENLSCIVHSRNVFLGVLFVRRPTGVRICCNGPLQRWSNIFLSAWCYFTIWKCWHLLTQMNKFEQKIWKFIVHCALKKCFSGGPFCTKAYGGKNLLHRPPLKVVHSF